MSRWLNDLYKKNELHFALAWIGLYCTANSLANPISAAIGIDSSSNFTFNLLLTIVLSTWIHRENAAERYGLCRAKVPAGRFLWYVPLILFMTHNLWFGIALNLPAADTVCYVLNMLCVGFLEEVIFRGFLFRALEKDDAKTAIVVSSVTFGLGHILNLFNGSGMELAENAVQVVGAI
ncbi:MAG: CPBP family intramembrane metalloprotease, partial [Oscillospiraceae bacterium]|nr:CPBP family intramembrane metalloprotease [Oscillospiraceae bacterium]